MEDKSGVRMRIKIEFNDSSTVTTFLSVTDKSNNLISLQTLEKPQIEYFLREYRKFIDTEGYNRTKSIFGRIQSAVQITGAALKNKQISDFYFSLDHGLSLTILNKFYTIDKYDDKCVVRTEIEGGKMINVIDLKSVGKLTPLIHNLTLEMIYEVYLNENKQYIQIYERMSSYLKVIFPSIISIAIINDLMNNLFSNPLNSNILYFYIFLLGLSFFPNVIFRLLINTFIYRHSIISAVEKKINNIKKMFKR